MPHKDDSLFSVLTVTMIIIIYLGNKADSEKNVSGGYGFFFTCIMWDKRSLLRKAFIIMGYAKTEYPTLQICSDILT